MGATVSTTHKVAERVDAVNVESEVIPFVMPIYYTEEPITPHELEAALKVWKMILNNRSEHFLALKRANTDKDVQEAENCMDYFMHNFYLRLFDIHPNCQKLFHRSIHKQGSFFLRFLSMCVAEVSEPEKLEKTMENLANIHNKIGVKAVECKPLPCFFQCQILFLLILCYSFAQTVSLERLFSTQFRSALGLRNLRQMSGPDGQKFTPNSSSI